MSKKTSKHKHAKHPRATDAEPTPADASHARTAPADQAEADELARLRKEAAQRDEYLDMLQRVKAEYSNYQKRVVRQQQELRRFASQDLVTDLLPVLDNLDRALEAGRDDPQAGDLVAGVDMVRAQMVQVLADHGVEALSSLGQPFDPNFHEAVLQQTSTEHPPGTVITDLQRGYTYNGRVVRPAKVVVSAAPEPGPASAGQEADEPAGAET